MQVPPTYAKVGPQVFPYLATAALAGAGSYFIAEALWRRPTALSADAEDTDWRALIAISIGFFAQILLIERVGFILSSACLFLAVAFGFGSRRTARDGAIGLFCRRWSISCSHGSSTCRCRLARSRDFSDP